MCFKRRARCLIAGAALLLSSPGASGESVYIPTSQDTRPAPEKAVFEKADFSAYDVIFETETTRYYWREDRDVLGIENKKSGYALNPSPATPRTW